MTWTEAHNGCQGESTDLVSVHSEAERKFVFSIAGGETVWTGGSSGQRRPVSVASRGQTSQQAGRSLQIPRPIPVQPLQQSEQEAKGNDFTAWCKKILALPAFFPPTNLALPIHSP